MQQLRQQMEQDWERAVEQAQENETRDAQFDANDLDNAAGMRVRSGVKAGGWLETYTESPPTCGTMRP